MVLTWILGGLAVGAAAAAVRTAAECRTLRGMYRECAVQLSDSQELAQRQQRQIEHLRPTIDKLHEEIRCCEKAMRSGCNFLKSMDILMTRNGLSQIAVVGALPQRPDLYSVVKIFEYDPSDSEDKDFAARRAEELIETIKTI